MFSRVNSRIIFLVLAAIGTIGISSGMAFDPPNIPGGKCVADYFEAFNGGEGAMKGFILECIAEQSLKQRTMEQRLEMYRNMQRDFGQLRPDRVVRADSATATILVESGDKTWFTFSFQFEALPPFKLLGIRIEEADPTIVDQPATPMAEQEFLDSLGNRLDKMAQNDEFSGVVLVAKKNVPIFQKAYGLANKEFGVPNRIDTKFNLGSINKLFTKVAIGQLIQKGKIKFEDTLGRFLPDYPNPEARSKVTVDHLLNMTAGIGDFFGEKYDNTPKDRFRTNNDFLPMFDSLPLAFEPGSRNQYSNGGYILLGAIIEAASGQEYYDYIRDNIYRPAGMTNSDSYEADMPVANLAEGYTRPEGEKEAPRRKNIYSRPARGSAAGGGYSTAEDLLKFTIALQENILLSPAYAEWLLTDERPGTAKPAASGPAGIVPPRGIGVAGGAPGINAALEADFSTGYTVVVVGNYDPPNAGRVAALARQWLTRVAK
ncbi:MAG: serine hydrolase [candidate division Zixibacteria bacterium]|nr:serine hydrolase [candidate division Zixibacteria bacterium]